MSSAVPTSWDAYARDFGIGLQRRRIAAGLTQEALAHTAGITRNHYQQIERGFWKQDSPANPSLQTVLRLAQALNLDAADLLPRGDRVRWT